LIRAWPLARVAPRNFRRGLHGLAEAAHRIREVVAAAARERVLARVAAGGLHGAAGARHSHRAAPAASSAAVRRTCVQQSTISRIDSAASAGVGLPARGRQIGTDRRYSVLSLVLGRGEGDPYSSVHEV